MGKAFEMMMAGLDDAIAWAEGDKTRGRIADPSRAAVVDETFSAKCRTRTAEGRRWAETAIAGEAPVTTISSPRT